MYFPFIKPNKERLISTVTFVLKVADPVMTQYLFRHLHIVMNSLIAETKMSLSTP
jgi:hypothetical protein